MHDLVTARGNFVHPRSEAFSGNGSQEYKRWTGDVGELVSLTCVLSRVCFDNNFTADKSLLAEIKSPCDDIP